MAPSLTPGADKIDPALRALMDEPRVKNIGPGIIGPLGPGGLTVDPPIPVALFAAPEADASSLEQAIATAGGIVTNSADKVILARLQAPQIERLASANSVYYIAPQPMVYPLQDVSSASLDTVRSAEAKALHQAGLTGKNVKVGVLDFGFQNYSKLVAGGRMPKPKTAKAWNKENNFELGPAHGTACAQIIHAMAPDAELYLAAMGGDASSLDQFANAAQWLANQGVQIISFSGGTHEGPHNGNALMDRIVDRLVTRYGVLWINAAGNEGRSHWVGDTVDRNHDGWIDIRPGSPYLLLRPETNMLSLLVTWDDWGADPQFPQTFQDIDAYLFRYADLRTSGAQPIAKSENPQNGRGFPMERIGPLRVQPGDVFVLGLRAKHVNRSARIHVYGLTQVEMEPRSPEGSVIIPAASQGAVAVGAVDVRSGELKDFSSRGPTDDLRIKPDLTAPENAFVDVGAGGRFSGTSAACPYVAGFSALLVQKYSGMDRQALRDKLLASTLPRGTPRPNNLYGFGELGDFDSGDGPSDSVLERLRSDAGKLRVPGLQLAIRVNPLAYRVGDPIRIRFTNTGPCYCALVDRDAHAHYTILQKANQLVAAGEHEFPEPGGVAKVTEPTGFEEILLIGSLEPIRWDEIATAHLPQLTVVSVRYEVRPGSRVFGKK
jgi:subtilisin family serine protease